MQSLKNRFINEFPIIICLNYDSLFYLKLIFFHLFSVNLVTVNFHGSPVYRRHYSSMPIAVLGSNVRLFITISFI